MRFEHTEIYFTIIIQPINNWTDICCVLFVNALERTECDEDKFLCCQWQVTYILMKVIWTTYGQQHCCTLSVYHALTYLLSLATLWSAALLHTITWSVYHALTFCLWQPLTASSEPCASPPGNILAPETGAISVLNRIKNCPRNSFHSARRANRSVKWEREGPHAWGLQTMDCHHKHHLTHMCALPSCRIYP